MSYKLQHAAEEIDRRLTLIEPNKNLLSYPYIDANRPIAFPAGLEDVGDGSILITGTVTPISGDGLLLATCPLTVGKKYTVSLDFTDIVDTAVPVANPGFELRVEAGTVTVIAKNDTNGNNASAELDLTNEAGDDKNQVAALVYIGIPEVSDTGLIGLVIKPQIEEGTEKTDWVPYMKTIGTYVDERFKGTNAKIKLLVARLEALERLFLDGAALLVEEDDFEA